MPQAIAGGAGLIVMLGTLTALSPLSIDLYLPSLPELSRDLGTSADAAQQSLSVFFLGLAIGQLLYGPASDRFGRRPVLLFGIVVYLVAGLVCTQAPTIGWLIGGRLVQGLGAAAGPVVARAAVRDVYQGARAARALSFVIMVMAAAPLIAPVIGGQILLWFDWRAIFWALVGFAVVCLTITLRALPETYPKSRRDDRRLVTLFAAYGGLLVDRRALAYLVCGGMTFAALFTYVTGSSFVYIDVFGIEPHLFGYYFAVNILGMVAGNYFNGRLVERFGYRRLLGVGITIMLVGSLALLAIGGSGHGGLLGVAIPLFFAVGTIGIVGANTVAGLLDIFPNNAGAASALFGVFQFGLGAAAGAMLGVLPGGAVLDIAVMMTATSAIAFAAYHYLARYERRLAAAASARVAAKAK